MRPARQDAAARARLGIVEWLRPGEHQRARQVLSDLSALGVGKLRTGFSWADWHTPQGKEWFKWLMETAAQTVELLPCFTYTPPSLGIEPKTASPPRDPKAFADFIDLMISEFGHCFDWIELWNEPNNLNDWDWRLDPGWHIFSEMIGMAAYWARQRGKKTVLAGMVHGDPNWLDIMCQRGVVEHIDAVGIHGFPGTWEFDWHDWTAKVEGIRQVLERHQLAPEIWITEAGYSTWRHDEFNQVKKFIEVVKAPAERIYWYSANDLHPHESHQDGFHEDERHYHFGLKDAAGNEKLLCRVWRESGLDGLYELARIEVKRGAGLCREPNFTREQGMSLIPSAPERKPVLVTGGAGFVGVNLAARLLEQGETVLIFDNLSRSGVERNLEWLCAKYGKRVQVEIADIRDTHLIRDAVHQASQIYHFAAQVAVTTSIEAPLRDFYVNMQGTLNILEAMRQMQQPPSLLFTSTNKVYGNLEDIGFVQEGLRYVPRRRQLREGLNEHQPLSFHSPYGCSKGSADQYVLDYARTYHLPATVFRMSCIYGPHQFGTEDQGWVAHFLIRALKGEPITLYGDGMQVRDILFVDDLVEALLVAHQHIDRLSGQAFNIGGGPANSISLLELLELISTLTGRMPDYQLQDWRLGDQKYYVSDTRRFGELTGWTPKTSIQDGVHQLHHWLKNNLLSDPEQQRPTKSKKRSFQKWQTQATLP